jgi:hypothetical protein
MFNLKLAVLLIAALALVGISSEPARASVVYDLTLTPTSGGNIGGIGMITISAAPDRDWPTIELLPDAAK